MAKQVSRAAFPLSFPELEFVVIAGRTYPNEDFQQVLVRIALDS
jgi:hypothetical protein